MSPPNTALDATPAHRYGRRVARTALLALLVVVCSATTAKAHYGTGPATPGNSTLHVWPTNGCSYAPDSTWGVFDFTHACAHHDGCYGGYSRYGQPGVWITRQQCDVWLYNDMAASCRWQHGSSTTWRAKLCFATARRYYELVRSLGARFYRGPWPA
jgi:hypothetical protein